MIEDAFDPELEVVVVVLIGRSSLDRIEFWHEIGDFDKREFLVNGGGGLDIVSGWVAVGSTARLL